MRLCLLPQSLARRTILFLLVGFAFIQMLGLLVHTVNQIKLERLVDEQEFATRAAIIYRHIALAQPGDRAMVAAKEPVPKDDTVSLTLNPPLEGTVRMPLPMAEAVRAGIFSYGIPPNLRPRGIVLRVALHPLRLIVSFGLPDGLLFPLPMPGGPTPDGAPPDMMWPPPDQLLPPLMWLTVTTELHPPAPWRSPGFATAFIVMMLLGGVVITLAVRQLLVPVKTLAAAAELFGRDVVNAKPLPEVGPSEIVTAARAFNTMAARIRRFVEDRTFLLTAIGHDLRTPITRLKLRAEYMEDDEQRAKMLADLDEMEAMVSATLAFGKDITTTEPLARLDLASLLRTIVDETADMEPERAAATDYQGPQHLPINARPLALKRALSNLITNAVKYGDAARVTLHAPAKGVVRIDIDDEGPGIPPEEMERVFEPFRRLETSRNRETGGSGLGLSIARNIVRAHGGDIVLTNQEKGLRVTVTLPV
ncbi:MAG: ATP-binding protein [Rhodospirillales bacterium]|nr:ATP-binding protein [Rhodospirillales bacterium]MDE1884167.1 ATP-binding protein [Rhodospirillales bacterium]